jgi:hypothetical protein
MKLEFNGPGLYNDTLSVAQIAAHMGQMRNAHKILVAKPKRKT